MLFKNILWKKILFFKNFLEKIFWLLYISDDYSLNIMTKNVEMIQITNVQKINLIRTEDDTRNLKIKKNKKFNK